MVSDDEPDKDIDDSAVDQTISMKRKASGTAAHKCLKQAEVKRTRLTNEHKAEFSVGSSTGFRIEAVWIQGQCKLAFSIQNFSAAPEADEVSSEEEEQAVPKPVNLC